jgi:hypothetical protein
MFLTGRFRGQARSYKYGASQHYFVCRHCSAAGFDARPVGPALAGKASGATPQSWSLRRTIVGARLPAIAVGQSLLMFLTGRFRGQARSYKYSASQHYSFVDIAAQPVGWDRLSPGRPSHLTPTCGRCGSCANVGCPICSTLYPCTATRYPHTITRARRYSPCVMPTPVLKARS